MKALTDVGYFGNGIYGTPQSDYAVRIYGKGAVVLCFMSLGYAYPGTESSINVVTGSDSRGHGKITWSIELSGLRFALCSWYLFVYSTEIISQWFLGAAILMIPFIMHCNLDNKRFMMR